MHDSVGFLFLENRNYDSVTLLTNNRAIHAGVNGKYAALARLSLYVVNHC